MRTGRASRPAGDDGFTLLEVLVSITLIGIVMTALTSFFLGTSSVNGRQGTRQAAMQLADDATEWLRSLPSGDLKQGRAQGAAAPADVPGIAAYLTGMTEWDQAGGTPTVPVPASPPPAGAPSRASVGDQVYHRYWYLGDCWLPDAGGDCAATPTDVPMIRAVVAVTWSDRSCPTGTCAYITTTLISNDADPLFNPNQGTAALMVTNPGNLSGSVTAPVSYQMTSTGGTPPVTWTAYGLPAGLAIDASTGKITGTPTASGTYSVNVSATDGNQQVSSVYFTWSIGILALSVTTPPAQSAKNGAAVTPVPAVASGGVPPYTWKATGLPPGLAIDTNTGVVSGSPNVPGTYAPKLTVTDSAKNTATTGAFTWIVIDAPVVTVPGGAGTNTVGDAVNVPITAHGGAGGYTWSATGLPPGLAIDGSTGKITGTVTAGTRYLTTVTATDQAGVTGTGLIDWGVAPGTGGLAVTGPAGDRTGDRVGTAVSVPLSATGGSGTGYAWSASGLPAGVALSGTRLTGTPSAAGSWTVTVRVTDGAGRAATFMFTWSVQ